MPTATRSDNQTISIKPPNFQTAIFRVIGTAPYVQNKFSQKAKEQMRGVQEAGSTARNKRNKEAKDFLALFEGATHRSPEGWAGIPAPAFRNAMISACRTVGFKMTLAKLSVFVEADGFDEDDGTPLVKITKGEPRYHESMVRLPTGVSDIRARPMWDAGWEAMIRITFDADQFTLSDVSNLLMRVGMQVVLTGSPIEGVITAVCIYAHGGILYEVAYWREGERKTVWVPAQEISNDLPKKQIGFKAQP